jgi:hypothetical protein
MGGDGPLLQAPLLQKLDLGLCGITTLTPKTFQGTSQLKELILDNNCLSLHTEAHSQHNIFSNLQHLSKLDLSSNKISEMDFNFLYDMTNLDAVDLSFNPAVCGECIRADKCNEFWSWCGSRGGRCVVRCNVAIERSVKKAGAEPGEAVAMEQGYTAQVLMAVSLFSVIIVLAVVLVVVVVRRWRNTGKFFPNITEMTLCQRIKRDIPTKC